MTLFPNTDPALAIGLFLLIVGAIILSLLFWFVYPIAKAEHRKLNRRLDELEIKVKDIHVNDISTYTDLLEDELYHQRRRNTGKKKRKQ